MVDRWASKRHLTLPDHAATGVIQAGSVESPAQHRLQIDKGRSFNDESTIQHTAQLDRQAMSTVGVALGGMLASAVIKVAIGHINSTISGEIKLHRNMRNDLENMKMTLESVEAVLGDAKRESIKHKSMLLWLKRLKDAANDISNMLEDFEDETDLNLWAATMKKIKMPRKMRSMQKRIQKIKEDRDSYGVQPETRCEERQVPDIRDTAGYVEEAEIIRRTDDCISGSTSYFPLLLTTVIGVSR